MNGFSRIVPATLLLGVVVLLGEGCERPFVERAGATFEVKEPQQLDHAFTQRLLPLSVKVSALRQVQRVRVNGAEMVHSERRDVWTDTVRLQAGVNALRVVAYEAGGTVSGRDTLYAAFLRHALNRVPGVLPAPRGGHTATLLPRGPLLVTGGAPRVGADASDDAFVLPPNQLRAQRLKATLTTPRIGHTATRLPDGRVLLLGGSRTGQPTSPSALVRTVEIYDPEERSFEQLPVQGDAPRRTRHVAVLLKSAPDPVVGIYGGLGDLGSASPPRLGAREDLRRFVLRRDTLRALDPESGLYLRRRLAGHTLTPLEDGHFLIAGSSFSKEGARDLNFRLNTEALNGYRFGTAPSFRTSRTQHAAVSLVGRGVLFIGGRQVTPASALRSIELHAPRAGRTFRVEGARPSPTFSLSVTKRAGNRILLLGGFSETGSARADAYLFDIVE